MAKLEIIRGVPGTGKSTYAKQMFPDHNNYEADMFFMDGNGEYKFDFTKLSQAHSWCYGQTQYSLMKGIDVVVSNTFTTWKELKPYVELAHALKVELNIYTLTTEYGSIHAVPEDKMQVMRDRFVSHKDVLKKVAEYDKEH